MNFHVGDQVIHKSHGPGIIIAVDVKRIADREASFLVVETGQLTIWVPEDASRDRIRFPVSKRQLKTHLKLLSGTAEQLPDFHRDRQGQLIQRMREPSFPDICLVIRDLAGRRKDHPLNHNDRETMGAAQERLLDEWVIVDGVSRETAREELERMLLSD